jgi:hypothetical protein
MKMKLSVYANGVIEWFVAESAEEAAGMLRKMNAEQWKMDEEELDTAFVAEPDDKTLKLEMDESGDLQVKERTCAEWASLKGKGFLATTEY